MSVRKSIWITAACVPFLSWVCFGQVLVPEGTKVRVLLDQQLTSKTANRGDHVRLSIADDVVIGDVVAIRRGTVVEGKVLAARPQENMGIAGKLDFSIDSILASDGSKISVRYTREKSKGGSSLGTGVLVYALAGVPGLIMLNGKDAILDEGTSYEVFTNEAVTLMGDSPTVIGSASSSNPSGRIPPHSDAPTIGVAYVLDPASQTLKRLPDQPWATQRVGDSALIEVSGERSPFRIQGYKPEFVFKIGSPQDARIFAFAKDEKDRKNVKRWFSLVHFSGKTTQTSPGLDSDITKFGDSSYKIVVLPVLQPGEYAVVLGARVFTFGIDQ